MVENALGITFSNQLNHCGKPKRLSYSKCHSRRKIYPIHLENMHEALDTWYLNKTSRHLMNLNKIKYLFTHYIHIYHDKSTMHLPMINIK